MPSSNPRSLLILFLGPKWWGSDARAMAAAFRRLGHSLIEVDYEDYFPIRWSVLRLRILRRLIRRLCETNYNQTVRQHLGNSNIDFVLVYKGMLLAPVTLADFGEKGIPRYCFYPDVSFLDHGENIWRCLPHYDCVFTTKSFHLSDPVLLERVKEMRFVPHGYDADLHRLNPKAQKKFAHYECDVSFVGCWSPQKEGLLTKLILTRPNLHLRIWGPGWERAKSSVREFWQRRGAYGDELVMIYCNSKINLGLLSEAGGGTNIGDQTTARTWQIPGCAGFMLHEKTDELIKNFIPGVEIAVFESPQDLSKKVEYYLNHDSERETIAMAGHRRCLLAEYAYDSAAEKVINYYKEQDRKP